MAFTLNPLATGQAAAGSPTSGTFTATANGDIYVFVSITGSLAGEAAPTSITCTDGSQGTFNLVYSQLATANSQITVAVYRSRTSGSPAAGSTITANVNAGNTDCELIVAEVPSGFNTTTPVVGIPASPVIGATTTPLSVTLSQTPKTVDMVIGVGASRNRLSASPLTAGTAGSFSISSGLHLERAAAPSASISVEQVTGYTGTTADMGNFNTVYSDLNAFIIQAASSGAPVAPVRPRQKSIPRRRDNNAPQASQDTTPPAAPQRRKIVEVALRRRGRVMPARAQVNPPMPPTPVRLKRFAEKVTQRRNPTPVPAQVNPPIVSGFLPRPHRHPERLTPHRQAVVVPAQQTAAPNPPLPMPMARDRRIPARMVRHNQAGPVPAPVVALVYPLRPARVKRVWARITRRVMPVPLEQVAPAPTVRHRTVQTPQRRHPGVIIPLGTHAHPPVTVRKRLVPFRPSRRRPVLSTPAAAVVLAPPVVIATTRNPRRPSPARRTARGNQFVQTQTVATFGHIGIDRGAASFITPGAGSGSGITITAGTGPTIQIR